jgi:hypothetical protein
MSKHNPIGITVAQAKLTYAKGLNNGENYVREQQAHGIVC